MNIEGVIAERIVAARVRIEATKRRRTALQAARQAGLARRHAARLRNLAQRQAAEVLTGSRENPDDQPNPKEETVNYPHEITNVAPYPISREEAAELLDQAAKQLAFDTDVLGDTAGQGLTPASLSNHAAGLGNLADFLAAMVKNLRMTEVSE